MNWINLTSENQLQKITKESFKQKVLVFKHSTRCSISSSALNRLERNWNKENQTPIYFLDLLAYRAISNKIAELFLVEHQSPQVLIIENGKCIYQASHHEIMYDEILSIIKVI